MKNRILSYEELYAEVNGTDFMAHVRNHVHKQLKEWDNPMQEDQMAIFTNNYVATMIDQEMLNEQFIENNKELLVQYIVDRVHTIEVLMDLEMHLDDNELVAEGARGLIYDSLKEIETVHPYVFDEIDPRAFNIIVNAQELFIKKLCI